MHCNLWLFRSKPTAQQAEQQKIMLDTWRHYNVVCPGFRFTIAFLCHFCMFVGLFVALYDLLHSSLSEAKPTQ